MILEAGVVREKNDTLAFHTQLRHSRSTKTSASSTHTVDARNLAPADMVNVPLLFTRFHKLPGGWHWDFSIKNMVVSRKGKLLNQPT